MPATIRHWISASPVMFAGIVTAAVTRPPMLVTKPCAPAYRTWFSITSWIARSTSPCCSRELLVGGLRRRRAAGRRPWIARSSASRTNDVVRSGRQLGDLRGQVLADAARRRSWRRCLRSRCRLPDPLPADYGRPCPSSRRPRAVVVRRPAGYDDRRRPGRDRRRPRARHAAGGVPARAVPDAVGDAGRPDVLVLPGPARRAAAGRAAGSRSLRRSVRDFEIRVDTAFDEVVAACADPRRGRRAGSTADIRAAYLRLHELGWAHSVETWRDGRLVGGLYGVAIGGLFAGRVDVPPRARRLEGRAGRRWSTCCATSTPPSGCSTCSGDAAPRQSSGSSRSPRATYLRRLPAALRSRCPRCSRPAMRNDTAGAGWSVRRHRSRRPT